MKCICICIYINNSVAHFTYTTYVKIFLFLKLNKTFYFLKMPTYTMLSMF